MGKMKSGTGRCRAPASSGKRKERECGSDDNGADEAAEDDHDEADDQFVLFSYIFLIINLKGPYQYPV